MTETPMRRREDVQQVVDDALASFKRRLAKELRDSAEGALELAKEHPPKERLVVAGRHDVYLHIAELLEMA